MIKSELGMLVRQLNEKEKRYSNFALRSLKEHSEKGDEVYRYWDVFELKLINPNAHQKKIGLELLAVNAKWDTLNKLDLILSDIIELCSDSSKSVVFKTLETLETISKIKPHLTEKIIEGLKEVQNEDWNDDEKAEIDEKIKSIFN